ncbi:hypothetical protein RDI58_006110 [Solanum bulbocastanum]|uniref:Peptidase S59 domain-containing protein n=1 Tax=Solanum bulbocastanum TaxID=147425 RepID=A0AAN8U088_SOLBU
MLFTILIMLKVSNNPAPLIIRLSSLSQHRLPPHKYKPTSDKPKFLGMLWLMDQKFKLLSYVKIASTGCGWHYAKASKEKEEADFCCHVKDFVVGRHGYGSIKFLGENRCPEA